MDPAQTTAPFFGGLLDTLWAFAVAWVNRYWWILVIAGVIYYTRWYRVALQTVGDTPATPLLALRAALVTIADRATQTTFHAVGAGMFIVGTGLWMLQAVGTLAAGVPVFDPVIWGNIAAIVVSAGAAFGLDLLPRHALFAFLAAAALAFAIGETQRRYGD